MAGCPFPCCLVGLDSLSAAGATGGGGWRIQEALGGSTSRVTVLERLHRRTNAGVKVMGHRFGLVVMALVSVMATGCGPTAGAWLYTLGLVPEEKVKAEYRLPAAPLLILVDDDQGLVQPPTTTLALVELLSEELRKNGAIDRVTTNDEIARLRQANPDFDRLSIREVARQAQADTVLWISVEEYAMENNLELVSVPARFAVRLKVFNARAEQKRDLRLWPPEREGKFVVVTVGPNELRRCKSPAEAHRRLAQEMADKIAKLFYDHTIKHEA